MLVRARFGFMHNKRRVRRNEEMRPSSLIKKINNNVQEIAALGSLTMARHFFKMIDKLCCNQSRVRKIQTTVGPIYIRSNNSDNIVMYKIFVDREYDLSKFPQGKLLNIKYQQMLNMGVTPLIIDAGANIGLAARFFALQFPKALIVCIEPDAANCALCRKNVESDSNIHVMEMAIGAAPGFVGLQPQANASWATRTTRDANGTAVVTIEEIRRRFPNTELFIVKIDIEGFESDLFSNNTEWVDGVAAILIEPHDWMMPGAGTSRMLQQTAINGKRELLILGENLALVRV